MKKLLLITIVFGALAMTSCNKNRYCDLDGENISGSVKVSKSDCEAAGGEWVKN